MDERQAVKKTKTDRRTVARSMAKKMLEGGGNGIADGKRAVKNRKDI